MNRKCVLAAALAAACAAPAYAAAADANEIEQLREEIKALKDSADARIKALEARLQKAEAAAPAPAPAPAPAQPAGSDYSGLLGTGNTFNPAISLILSGLYTNLSQDPSAYHITGFQLPRDAEVGPGPRGFSLAESELGIYANIDPYFYGGLNLAAHPDDTVSVEEAFVQTVGLTHGLTLKAGRFFSGIGYLNEQHAHVWDFVDAPLAYQAFLGGQLGDDGVQVRWLAPTETYLQIGAEAARGRSFPGSDRDKNSVGAATAYVHVGSDIGVSSSWRAGLSLLQTAPNDRRFDDSDLAGVTVTNAFTGTSRLWVADFVWKYAPNGNPSYRNFKLQGEYLRRREYGDVTYDVDGASLGSATSRYDATQSGWYLQAVYQFRPYWRVGLRTEQLDSGSVDYSGNNAFIARPDFNPRKNSAMVDFSPSEFSRIRLQIAQDKSRQDATDNQIFVQYLMSLGAHGAHNF